jgi:hypothetical protein
MMAGLLLLLITTFHPVRATIGDPVTIDFAVPTTVDPSPDYEVIARTGNSVVIRTFVPHTITVTGRAADGPVSVMIPIHSVLAPDDKLEPAPLKPPIPERWPRLPFVAIGISALAALAAWTAVVIVARRRVPKPRIVIVPAEAFRARVLALRGDAPMRWAGLADAVRAFLAAVRPDLGAELTTKELLARAGDSDLAQILRQGDLEKFSPWGAAPANFDDALKRALEIPSWAEPQPMAEEVAA